MTFEEALAQIEVAVREISKERFVAEMVSLRAAFEKTVQELTREAKRRGPCGDGLAQGAGLRDEELTAARNRQAGSSMPSALLRDGALVGSTPLAPAPLPARSSDWP
jgi:hypothetical protein